MIIIKHKKIISFILIIISLSSYIYLFFDFSNFNDDIINDGNETYFDDIINELRTSGMQYSGLTISLGDDLQKGVPYVFGAYVWNDLDLEEQLLEAKLQTKSYYNNQTNEYDIDIPENNIDFSNYNIDVYNGSINTFGNLTEGRDGEYDGIYSFTYDTDGVIPNGWIDISTGGCYASVESPIYGRNKVLHLEDVSNSYYAGARNNFNNQSSGIIEFWMYEFQAALEIRFYYDDTIIIRLRCELAYPYPVQAYNGTTPINTGYETADFYNKWYHFKIKFDMSIDKWNFFLNNEIIAEDYDTYNTGNYINNFRITTGTNPSDEEDIDAVDYSWADGYYEGRNFWLNNSYFLNSSNIYEYPATYTFDGETGKTGTDIDFVDSSNLLNCEVVSEYQNHRAVLYCKADSDWEALQHYTNNENGTFEFWINPLQTNKNFIMRIFDEGTSSTQLLFRNNGDLSVWTGDFTKLLDYSSNTWYHIKIEFDISENKYLCYVNGSYYGNYGIYSGISKITKIQIGAHNDGETEPEAYIDAWGESWDSNYQIGDNYYWQNYLGTILPEDYNITESGWYDGYDSFNYRMDEGYYKGSAGFSYETIGTIGDLIDWINTDNSADNCTASIIAELDNHKNVLECNDQSSSGTVKIIHEYSISSNQIIEFWIAKNTTTDSLVNIQFYEGSIVTSNNRIYLIFDEDDLKSYDGTTWNNIALNFAIANTFYHIKLELDDDNNQFTCYINGVDKGTFDYRTNSSTGVDKIRIETDSLDSDFKFYLDAPGLVGETDPEGYTYHETWNINPYDLDELLDNFADYIHIPYANSFSISDYNNHYNCLNITRNSLSGADKPEIYNAFSNQESGTIEFWWLLTDTSSATLLTIRASGVICIYLRADSGVYDYYDTSSHIVASCANNVWYHHRIDFDCTTDTFDWYINGTLVGDDCDFYGGVNPNYVNRIDIIEWESNNYSNYFDAVDFSWRIRYNEGDNLNPYGYYLHNSGFLNNWTYIRTFQTYPYIQGFFDNRLKVINLTDNSATNYTEIYHDFDNQVSGIIEFWIYTPPSGNGFNITIGKDTNIYQINLRLHINGKLQYWDLEWLDVISLSPETWYHLRIDFDCVSDTYDLYVNGVLEKDDRSFFFGRDYLNKLTIKTIDYQYNYSFLIDSVGFSWYNDVNYIEQLSSYSILNFTLIINYDNFGADLLELYILRNQYYCNMTLYIYNFDSSIWVDISTVKDSTTFPNIYVYHHTDDENYLYYINDSRYMKFRFIGINYETEFNYSLQRFHCLLYRKINISYTVTFWIYGVYSYRFKLYYTSLGYVYTNWIDFNVVEREPNFQAVSESQFLTEWILTGTESSITYEIIYEDDLTGYSWSICEASSSQITFPDLSFSQDSWVWSAYPTTNYGSSTELKIYAWTPTSEYADIFLRRDYSPTGYITESMGGIIYIYHVSSDPGTSSEYIAACNEFDESTVTWNNQPADITTLTTFAIYSGISSGWKSHSFSCTQFYSNFHWQSFAGSQVPWRTYYSSESVYNPYISWYINKIRHNTGSGYVYYQTGSTELIGVKSPEFTERTINRYSLVEVDLETDQNDVQLALINNGIVQKTIQILQYNSEYNRQTVTAMIDEDVTFDQVKLISNLQDKQYTELYNIKISNYISEDEETTYRLSIAPGGDGFKLLPIGTMELKIYENDILKVDKNITIDYNLHIEIFNSFHYVDVYISLYDINNELLDFNKFLIYVDYVYGGNDIYNELLFSNSFTVDLDTIIRFEIYDSFDTLITNESRVVQQFISITIAVLSLKINNKAYKQVEYSLTKVGSSITKSGILVPDELKEYLISIGNYSITYVNYEDMILRDLDFEFISYRIIYINTTYKEIYFALFTYDGFGVDPSTIRFYINSTRHDLGFNTITSRFINITVLDFFGYVLFQNIIDTYIYDMAYNIYIEIYTLTLLNLNNFFNIKVNISRGSYWMEQVIPMGSGLSFRFLPNVNYSITAKYLNDTIIEIRYINLTTNGHIQSFGETLPYPVDDFFPADMWINLYNAYGFSITSRLRIYKNGTRIEGGMISIETNHTNIVIRDYFDSILYNQTVPYSKELNIQINTTTVIIHNECRVPIIVRIKRKGETEWRISQTLGEKDGLIFEFINDNYTIQGEYMWGAVIATKDIEVGTDEKVVSFGFYEEEVPEELKPEDLPSLITTLQHWAIIILFIVTFSIISVILYYKLKVKKMKKREKGKKENNYIKTIKDSLPFY